MRYVVTGANRGIGLALVEALLARKDDAVIAAVRDPLSATELQRLRARGPERLQILTCDVPVDESVTAFAEALSAHPIDVLINNAGVLGKTEPFASLDLEDTLRTLQTNTLGPLRMMKALLPALKRGATRKVLNLSSRMALDAGYGRGGAYAYRLSKAALHQATRAAALELRGEGFVIASIHPGWVRTSMGGTEATLTPEESARDVLAVLDALGPERSGQFLDHTGEVLEG